MLGQLGAMETTDLVEVVAIAGGCLIAVVAIVSGAVTRHAKVREREKSRREIAAYVAEGSMTPEEGERLIAAGRQAEKKSGCCG